jgi:hypothetical protein
MVLLVWEEKAAQRRQRTVLGRIFNPEVKENYSS